MKKALTVKELREALERIEKEGYADFQVWFADYNDMTWSVEEGVHDIYEKHGDKAVILG